jgi:hypothetical protein
MMLLLLMVPKLFVRGYSVFFDTKWFVRGLGKVSGGGGN